MPYGSGSYGGSSYGGALTAAPPAPPDPPTRIYDVFVVDQTGSVFGQIADPHLEPFSSELNGPGTARFTLPTTDPDAALVLPGREVQIWRDGQVLWWGPLVRRQAGLDESSYQCAGLPWYLAHRFMGRADRVNQLTNGDFEAGEDGWSFSGVTHSIDTATFNDGTQSLKLTGAALDHNTYAYQIYTHAFPTPAGWPGDFMTGAAWVNISAADYVDPAKENRGLVLIHRDPAGNLVDVQVATINDDTPRGTWGPADGGPDRIPLEVGVANVKDGDTVEMRLYPPHGVANYDTVTLTFMESLAFGGTVLDPPVDVTDIIGGIVDYAQDRGPFTHGKSDLNIGWAGDPTGDERKIAYQFAEHRQISDSILEYVRQGVCDISVEFDATTRTFTVWPKSTDTRTPQLGKGVTYSTVLELDVNLAAFTYSSDLEQAASSVVLLGPGDGPDRPEGGAVDTSLLGGAYTMEIVEQAPDQTTIGQLDTRAAERLDVAAHPDILEVTTLPGAGVIGAVHEGDTVTVVIPRGWVDIDDTMVWRVVRVEVDPHTDQATLALNPVII